MAKRSPGERASLILRTMMVVAVLALSACADRNRAGQGGYIDHNNDGRYNPG